MFTSAFKSAVVASVVAFLAVAKGSPAKFSGCDNGSTLQCCTHYYDATTAQENGLSGLLGLLGIGGLTGDIGLECTAINVLGIGNGATCNQQAACCDQTAQYGFINVGCSPIDLAL